MSHQIVLLRDQVHDLVQTNEIVIKRKSRKRKRIQQEETLTDEQDSILSAQKFAMMMKTDKRRKKKTIENAIAKQIKHCKRCDDAKHNTRICENDNINKE